MNLSAIVAKKDTRIYALYIGLSIVGGILVWQKVITWKELLGFLGAAGLLPSALGEEKAVASPEEKP